MSYSPAFSQAIEILISIELKQREEFIQYLSIQKIAEGLNIPVPSVKRLVAMLKKSNLIASKPGIKGGLLLTRKPEEISFYDVLLAVEGQQPLFQIYQAFELKNFHNSTEALQMLDKGREILTEIDESVRRQL
ncbi:MAG: Rrf2 family transcriptional regulator, partial [Streptococcaceae bacterium]|nr:Rrf2 family transcriptional regulator [Streptococcaceae bacterium]